MRRLNRVLAANLGRLSSGAEPDRIFIRDGTVWASAGIDLALVGRRGNTGQGRRAGSPMPLFIAHIAA